MPSALLYAIIFSFAGGVLLETYRDVSLESLLHAGIITLAVSILIFFWKRARPYAFLLVLACIAFSLGVLRMQMDEQSIVLPVESAVGEKVNLRGTIVREVERRETNQRMLIQVESDDAETADILVTTDLYPLYHYGDVVEFSGTLAKPENFLTDQGKEFDYVNYLAKDDIFYTMSFAHLTLVDHDAPSRFKELLFRFKASLEEHIGSVMPAPESTFMEGIALGSRAGIGSELRDQFVATGTIHIVALSGYNISVVADGIQKFFSLFFMRTLALSLGSVSIILFVLMTGAQATAVRAGIMAVLALLARATGRTYDISRALFLAGLFMLLQNPNILAHDVSFQLSFLATLGMVYLTPLTKAWFEKGNVPRAPSSSVLAKTRGIAVEVVSTTLAAQIAVAPFILYAMGTFSIVSFPLNLLIIPLVPIAMYLGFAIALLGFAGTWFTLPLGFLSTLFLRFILRVIEWGASLPHALLSARHVPISVCVVLYTVIIGWVLLMHSRQEKTT